MLGSELMGIVGEINKFSNAISQRLLEVGSKMNLLSERLGLISELMARLYLQIPDMANIWGNLFSKISMIDFAGPRELYHRKVFYLIKIKKEGK